MSSTFFVTARSWLFMMATSLSWVVISRRTPAKPMPVVRTMSLTCATVMRPADENEPTAAVDDAPPARAGGVAPLATADVPLVRGDTAPLSGKRAPVPVNEPARGCCDELPQTAALAPEATAAPAPAAAPPAPGGPLRRVSDELGG